MQFPNQVMFCKHLGIENADSFITSYREFDSMRPGLEPGVWGIFCFCFCFPFFKKMLIDLTMPGISCSMQTLRLACMWDLVPLPGMKPRPPVVGEGSLSHWTMTEVPFLFFYIPLVFLIQLWELLGYNMLLTKLRYCKYTLIFYKM